MPLTIDELGKAREIWELLVKVPIDNESLYRYIAIAGLREFEKACQQVNAHVRGCGKLPRNLNRWLKDHLHSRRSQASTDQSLAAVTSKIANRILEIRTGYSSTQPYIPQETEEARDLRQRFEAQLTPQLVEEFRMDIFLRTIFSDGELSQKKVTADKVQSAIAWMKQTEQERQQVGEA